MNSKLGEGSTFIIKIPLKKTNLTGSAQKRKVIFPAVHFCRLKSLDFKSENVRVVYNKHVYRLVLVEGLTYQVVRSTVGAM